ncbi:MAG: PAS domain S-box protein [Nitrososphaerota archaeon]|nr:PAS domain S-box protein [Nitrososphaerota archaeon]
MGALSRRRRGTEVEAGLSRVLYSIFNSVPDIIYIKNAKRRYVKCNESFKKLVGLNEEDIIGKTDEELLPPELAEQCRRSDIETLKTGKTVKAIEKLSGPDGEIIFETIKVPFYGRDGRVLGLVGISRDITEKEVFKERLEYTNRILRGLYECASNLIMVESPEDIGKCIFDAVGSCLEFNLGCFGVVDRDQLQFVYVVGAPIEDVRSRYASADNIAARAVKTGQTQYISCVNEASILPFLPSSLSAVAVPVKLEEKVVAVIYLESKRANGFKPSSIQFLEVIARNLSYRIGDLERLERERRLQSILENASEVIYTLSNEGIVTSLNPSFEKITGWSREEWIGRPFSEIIHPEDLPLAIETFERTIRGEALSPYCLRILLKSGDFAVGEFTSMPLIDKGKIVGEFGIVRDVTERKRLEERIAYEKSLLDALMETGPDAIYFKDRNSRFIMINKAEAELLGLKDPSEAVGKTDFDYFSHEHAAISLKDEQEIINGVKPYITRLERVKRSDGQIRWLLSTKVPLRDKNNEIIGVMGIARDVTELKFLEEQLSHERKLMQALMDNMPDSIYFKDANSRFIKVNKAFAARRGLRPEDLIGKTDFDVHSPEFAKEAYEDEQRIIKTGQPVISKLEKIVDRSGTIRWVSATKVPLKDEAGRIVGVLGISRDVTSLKHAEEILASLHNYAYRLSTANEIEEVARITLEAVEKLLGCKIAGFALVENNCVRFTHMIGVDAPEPVMLPLNGAGITVRAVRTGETQIVPDTSLDKDFVKSEKSQLSLSELAVPVKVGDKVEAVINLESVGKNAFSERDVRIVEILALHVGAAIDRLRYLKRLEEAVQERTKELQKYLERLKSLDKIKDQFISTATHEIRTPLVSIKGYTDLLLSGKLGEIPEKIRSLLTIVAKNTDRLLELTNELLEAQRIQRGRLQINKRLIDFREVIESSVEEFKPLMEKKGLTLEVAKPDKPMLVHGDPLRLTQVITNLLSNAYKFTPEGGRVALRCIDEGSLLKVQVSDTGIGIAQEDLNKLFQPFPNIQRPNVTEPSIGLGLSICKGIVSLHDGQIWAESPGIGKGATFTFTLPKASKGEADHG